MATATPVTIEVMYGVWNFGWILFTNGGSRPSCDIVQKTRDWPSNMHQDHGRQTRRSRRA